MTLVSSRRFAICCLALLAIAVSHASSLAPISINTLLQFADASFRGVVLGSTSFRGPDRLIYTRTDLRVEETFKGILPEVVRVVHRGGTVNDESEFHGLSPRFVNGGAYLMFVNRAEHGHLHCAHGAASAIRVHDDAYSEVTLAQLRALSAEGGSEGADVRDQAGSSLPHPEAITGMLQGENSRFIQCDRGEPIIYIIDAAMLPSGMSLNQATNAVRQALDAWAEVTSLRFEFGGLQNFGQGADTVSAEDGRLRIQLHDTYGRVSGSDILGIGGRTSRTQTIGPGWDLGGRVNDAEFKRTTHGYVVLKASHSAMQNLTTFTEVLCHEIGHALNLAHSSETPTQDPLLRDSIMYFQTHADGRGATLGAYDPPVIQQIYPFNTPPFSNSRVIDVITAPDTPAVVGINEVEVRGYDLQLTVLSLQTAGASSINGSFAADANRVRYTPAGWFSDSDRLNPAGNMYYDVIYGRFSDGTNASPWISIRVISLRGDSDEPSDGLPDYWMGQFFGHDDPRPADLSRAQDDPDSDGLTNLEEFLLATNPTSAASALRLAMPAAGVLNVALKPFDVYEIQGSTNLINWFRVGTPVVTTNGTMAEVTQLPQSSVNTSVTNLPTGFPSLFLRVERVP